MSDMNERKPESSREPGVNLFPFGVPNMSSEGWVAFQTSVPGKWVLAGEHAVIRGAPAVALPRLDCELSLEFEPSSLPNQGLEVYPQMLTDFVENLFQITQGLAQGPWKETLKNHWANVSSSNGPSLHSRPSGKLRITSTIPIGAGIGSSAAICVALSRWVGKAFQLELRQILELGTRLEDFFHGKSSGMDIATVSVGEPIVFYRGRGFERLGVDHLPTFTFHDTGLRSLTKECVLKVETFLQTHPEQGQQLEEQMREASLLAVQGLREFNDGRENQGLKILADSMKRSQNCFEQWGLVPERVRQLQGELERKGARGVKLTGAGNGGFLVALWDS